MKKLYALLIAAAVSGLMTANAQTVNNSGFENWENVGTDTEEPISWNSFKTAQGALTTFAQKQMVRSTVVRPGTTGQYSALLWSRSTMGIIANGNVTTGRINMGNVVPSSNDNYNISLTGDTLFSEVMNAVPDSIAFWVRFKPASGNTTDSGRMHAVIHDNYDYRDPNAGDPNAAQHIVAQATGHFAKTDGLWIRQAVPFVAGPASTPLFILITFTTNKTPGGGSGGDSLYIDDIEMIYNSISINEPDNAGEFRVYTDASSGQLILNLNFDAAAGTLMRIYNINGQLVMQREKSMDRATEIFDLSTLGRGIYVVDVQRADGRRFSQKFSVNE